MSNKGFEIHSLGEILINSQYGLNIPSSDDGTVPIFKMNNFNQGKMDPSNLDKVKISEDEIKRYKLEKDDILFNRTNSLDLVGKAGIFDLDGEYVFASYLVRLKVNPKLACAKYINYFLNKDSTKRKLKALATAGVSQANINPTQLKKRLFIPLAPKAEQKKIAQILSKWDKTITTTEKLLANSEQQKKALMQQLLTGKKRFPNFCEDWQLIPVSAMGKIVSGGTPDTNTPEYWNGGIHWLTPTDVTALRNKYVYQTERTISESGLKNSSAKILSCNSLVICTRATIGAMAITRSNIATNQGFKSLVPDQKFSVEFLYYLFSYLLHQFIRKASGSTFLELSKRDFEKTEFLCPKLEEQQKIAEVLSTSDREIETLKQKLDCLKQEKKALMQQLLTGKRRVYLKECE